jgi:endonuclease G
MKKFACVLVIVLGFTCYGFGQKSGTQLVLGAPRKLTAKRIAKSSPTDLPRSDDYPVEHTGFVLSYNQRRGGANWVTWHLSAADIGAIKRRDPFGPDEKLPTEWRIAYSDYTGSGYDRGHMCPSEDRTDTQENNDGTFRMSNMQPQVGSFNGGIWKSLEAYAQQTVKTGMEAYITAGCYGDKGRIKDKVTIPTRCWKVLLILPEGSNDRRRINCKTKVVAVDMPNERSPGAKWTDYRITVDDLEKRLGLDFLNRLSKRTQSCLEGKLDK